MLHFDSESMEVTVTDEISESIIEVLRKVARTQDFNRTEDAILTS